MKLGISRPAFCLLLLAGPYAQAQYADVRTDVSVKKLAELSWDSPRPANFFQLAGARVPQLCEQALQVFNEPGEYHGEDRTRWLLDNSHQVEFHRLPSLESERLPETAAYVFPGLEYTSIDLDADGATEDVYRLNGVLSSQWYQRLMIVPEQLQKHPDLLARHAERCVAVDPKAQCDSIYTKIRYAMMAAVPERLPNEWMFTREGVLSWVVGDARSRQAIDGPVRNSVQRNVGSSSGVYWSLYKLGAAVVVVSAPNHDFATPELLVFTPSRSERGILQCVIMPAAWPK